MAGEGAVLDPLALDRVAELARRVDALEQRPKVVPPIAAVTTPYLISPGADWYMPFTNAAYGAGSWSGILPKVALPGVYCRFAWRTGAGTTGEVRLLAGGGATMTSAVALAAASSGTITFHWLHGHTLWQASQNLDLEARRTAGANLVEIQAPIYYLTDAAGCTLTGL